MEVQQVGFTYSDLVQKINTNERFSFSRFGDGENNAIFRDQRSNQNCDGHSYFPDLGDRLLKVLEDYDSNPNKDSYYLGLQAMAQRQRPDQIDALTFKHKLTWCNAGILHTASIKGQLQSFIDALNGRDVLFVGPAHLKKLTPKWIDSPYFITVPDKNCWLEYEAVKENLKALIGVKEWVVCFCASMMSGVLIDDFHGQATLIDCGSVFDPYCDVKSRSYHKKLTI